MFSPYQSPALPREAFSNPHLGPCPDSTTRPDANAAGDEAADEVLDEIGGSCPTNDPEARKAAARKCRQKCQEKSENEYGGSFDNWFLRCQQVCTNKVGCGNFFP